MYVLLHLSPYELIFKPDLISFPAHIASLLVLSLWLTILNQQLRLCPE